MPEDPIVEEVRTIRDAYARRFAYDLDAICKDVRRREHESGVKTVTLPPRPANPTPAKGDRTKP